MQTCTPQSAYSKQHDDFQLPLLLQVELYDTLQSFGGKHAI